MNEYRFKGEIFRRIGYMKIYMQDGLADEEFDKLSPADQGRLRERTKGYGDAIDDVLTVLRQLRLP